MQIRNERRNPEDPMFYQEDAVTEIIHDYFDQGIRISNMAGLMSVNAAHIPSLMQIQKIYEIIRILRK